MLATDAQQDALSVAIRYGNLSSAAMDTWLVPGSPYLTFSFTTATPKFTAVTGTITSVNSMSTVQNLATCAVGSKFKVVTTNSTYIIYSLSGPVTMCTDTQLKKFTSLLRITAVFRIVKLRDPSHESTIDTYTSTYPTGSTLGYTFSGSSATLTFTYTTVGTASQLLMLTWPHHRYVYRWSTGLSHLRRSKALVSPSMLNQSTQPLSYLTTKGWMYPVIGSTWTMSYSLPTIDFNAPRTPDSSCNNLIINGLVSDVGNLGTPPQPNELYYWGGKVAAASRLA